MYQHQEQTITVTTGIPLPPEVKKVLYIILIVLVVLWILSLIAHFILQTIIIIRNSRRTDYPNEEEDNNEI